MSEVLLQSQVAGLPCRRGKVRDVYDLGTELVIVATDRISAFDWVLPSGIPGKGAILTALTVFWLDVLRPRNHFLELVPASDPQFGAFTGRAMRVRKTAVVPIECVVRGHLAGSGWLEYQQTRAICGIPLPDGLRESERLPEPLFTPATKEDHGHDVNIDFSETVRRVGPAIAELLRTQSLRLYTQAAEYARSRGLILADTKFEFGILPDGELILIDEVLTPDSSRYWPADVVSPGSTPPSFDKQFVRDWLKQSGWDRNSPPPELPAEVVTRTAEKYREAFARLTGRVWIEPG